MVDSSCRNHYKKTPTGDAHCRGLWVVINCTFTAGGLSLPLFVVVYGIGNNEMVGDDDMITIKVPGLTIGSDQDVYSCGFGYLTFVCRKHDEDKNGDEEQSENSNDDGVVRSSKESRIASKYRHLIYHPFIDHIRITRYDWDPVTNPDVPNSLSAVSWMDGANGQLKKITCEKNLEFEKKRKVVCCKHSASRTAVEQAADTGAMFKVMKLLLKEMDSPNSSTKHIHHYISRELDKLQQQGDLILSSHKKKALLATLPKLPNVTGRSHSIANVRIAFIVNGQLDINSKLVPSFSNLLHTFRGDIRNTCLENKQWLISKFYSEMYTNGIVSKDLYDRYFVPQDRDMNGFTVSRVFGITQENRQRAKVLSSTRQIAERKQVIYQKKLDHYQKCLQLYQSETKDYVLNKRCENKLVDIITSYKHQLARSSLSINEVTPLPVNVNMTVKETCNGLTLEVVLAKKSIILIPEARAFVKVRSNAAIVHGRRSFQNIPLLKDDILEKVVEMLIHDVNERYYKLPIEPVRLRSDIIDSSDDSNGTDSNYGDIDCDMDVSNESVALDGSEMDVGED